MLRRTPFALLIALLATPALGAPGSMAERAKAYAQKNNLPLREVAVDVGGRKEVRIFVPVTDATHADFMKAFTEEGSVIRQGADLEHVQLALNPDKAFVYGTLEANGLYGAPVEKAQPLTPNQGGRYIALGLDADSKAHLGKNLGTLPQGTRKGGCMWWLVHAKVGADKPLAHEMGVKQSAAPSNLIKKLVHAGNDKVVVGVAMSEQVGQVQNLRNQLANFDRNIQNIQVQIQNLEAQGGNRIKTFESQAAPYRQAIAQVEATIAQRQAQPAIVAALQTKVEGYKKTLATLTEQHTAPYQQRLTQLDQMIANGKATLQQRQTAFAPGLKAAEEQVAQRERARDGITRNPPGTPNARFERRLIELDQSVNQLQAQFDQGQPQREALRGQARNTIANGEQQVRDTLQHWPNLPANARNENAYNQRLAQLSQQIAQHQNTINTFANQPAQKANVNQARALVAQLTTIKDEVAHQGPKNFDVLFDSKLGQTTWVVAQGRIQLGQLDIQEEQLRGQITQLRADREQISKSGPDNFHPEYDAEAARLDQVIAQNKAQLIQYQANPIYVNRFRAQLAANEQAKAKLATIRPQDYNPQYEGRLAQLDLAINQNQAQLNQYLQLGPQQALNVQASRQQLEQNQKVKAELTKLGPAGYDPQFDQKLLQANQALDQARAQVSNLSVQREAPAKEIARNEGLKAELQKQGALNYNPAYEQRLVQIDQQNDQIESQIRMYATPQYAPSRVQWQAQLDQGRQMKQEILAKGPAEYFPNEPQIRQYKTQLEQTQGQAAAVRLQLETAEAIANRGTALAEKFAALSDQALLGPPPGGEAVLR